MCGCNYSKSARGNSFSRAAQRHLRNSWWYCAGETPPIAAIREALEEANIEVELEYIIGTYLLTGGSWPDIFATVYKAHIVRGEPKAGDADEIRAVLWGSPHDLPSPLVTDAKAAVEDLLLGNRGVVRTVERTGVMPKLEED
jgi:8-oxo-dGTP diphosphatase